MKRIFLQTLFAVFFLEASSQTTIVQYLSGTDKDHTIPWKFYCSAGRNSGEWTTIPVPSNWEQQGFGQYNYGHDKIKNNEQGIYKHEFAVKNISGKRVFIVFEGSMTDTKVMINGRQAGPVHQGAFYRFKYDITGLLKPNTKNELEVAVDKTSADASVNRAERNGDFWIFGGIFRPVYLEIVPDTFIDRVAVDAKADGSFQLDVYAQNLHDGEVIEAQVQKLSGEKIGKPFSAETMGSQQTVRLKNIVETPRLWSAEFPNLYEVVVSVKNKQKTIHQVRQRFGFRTVELRLHDALYVNGQRIMMKGCNRHSFWPETGRTLSRAVHLKDVLLMKEMNMNAVRMSHYPPDAGFLDICDSLGLYVLDELTGWQAAYDTTVGRKLVKELVVRDVNHPSILFWDNGNEGGWNRGLDKDYDLYDPQKRVVLHPWEKFNGTDTKHYPDYAYMKKSMSEGQDVFFPTEFMHGLYDGGAGAALDDFWNLMTRHPHGAGGFIWALLDEAVIRTDKKGIYDGDGNHAPDGIVGPHREKEASFYTIKEIWSPIYIDPKPIDSAFTGEIAVENRYSFTNLNQCSFTWTLAKLPAARDKTTTAKNIATGTFPGPDLAPAQTGKLHLPLPSSWRASDVMYLTARSADKKEIFTWSWALHAPVALKKIAAPAKTPTKFIDTGQSLQITCDDIRYGFDKRTGYIEKVITPSGALSLSGGPMLAGVSTTLSKFSHRESGTQRIVEATYEGDGSLRAIWTFEAGHPVRLDYAYTQQGEADFMGITFNYPGDKITGMKWLGRGPFRVWKNRLRGQRFGVWHKSYNSSVTGESWKYPEFKGYHAEVNWVTVENAESPFTVYTDDQHMFFQMLHPDSVGFPPDKNHVEPAFPLGSIGFLQAISPIGTKFQSAETMGPQSQKTKASDQEVRGTLWFDFTR